MKHVHQYLVGLALAAGIIIAATAACAAPAQTFEALLAEYGLNAADAQVRAHSLALDENAEALGVRIGIEGLYTDGDRLLIGWKTENTEPERPALVLYTDVRIGGISVGELAFADYPISLWWPQAFGLFVTGDPINGLMNGYYTEEAKDLLLKGKLEVEVSFTVQRPLKPLVMVDADILTPYTDADTEADRQSMLAAMEACGVTVAQPGGLDAQAWMDKGYLPLSYGGDFLGSDGTTDGMAALNGECLADADQADVTLKFTVDFDALSGK